MKHLKSDWLITMSCPPIREGSIIVNGNDRIEWAGPGSELPDKYKGIDITTYPDSIIMPSLVNAHTHLYFAAFSGLSGTGDEFVSWVEKLVTSPLHEQTELIENRSTELAGDIYTNGTTLIGNVSSNPDLEAKALHESKLRGVSYIEVMGFTLESLDKRIELLRQYECSSQSLKYTIMPHALYSCSSEVLTAINRFTLSKKIRTAIHLAESEEEVEFIEKGTGSMRSFLNTRGVLPPDWNPPGLRPVEYLEKLGVLSSELVAVHCVQVNASELDILAHRGVHIVTCPVSNETLNVGVAPLDKILERGINIAIGTDSPASNPEMRIGAEMTLIRRNFPLIKAETILQMATINGAVALGFEDEFGSLEAGKRADFVTIPSSSNLDQGYIYEYCLDALTKNRQKRPDSF